MISTYKEQGRLRPVAVKNLLSRSKFSDNASTFFSNRILGTSVLNPGAGFLRIFTVAFVRLF